MDIFEQISAEVILFFIIYGITGVVALIAALYLLLRRGNAFAPSVTPPVRLRRWAASFFAVMVLGHVWWLLFCFYSRDIHSAVYVAIVLLDCVTLLITIAGTLLAMLQDRKRPVWPAFAAMIPFTVLVVLQLLYPNGNLIKVATIYIVALYVLFSVYMVFATRQYGRWLNDNYADLEHKKVWLSQLVSLACLSLFILYTFVDSIVLFYLLHAAELLLFGLLLWRVETLPQLKDTPPQPGTAGASHYRQYRPRPDRTTVGRALRRHAALPEARPYAAAAGPGHWHQPLLPQPVLLPSGHHLQHLYQ